MKIGEIELSGNLFLAPMAGVSDVGLRFEASKFGAAATVTEMVSAKALIFQSKKTEELLFSAELPPCKKAVQIFGHEPRVMADACLLPVLDKFDWIDINFGCPANKIVKNCDGSSIMKNSKLAYEIVSACVQKSKKPISVKIRKGFGLVDNTAVDFARVCEDAGASLVTIHGRTSEQGYSGNVDLKVVEDVKNALKIPVVGNGDVTDLASYEKMNQTGVDGIMIGRGALGSPWIFSCLQGKDFSGSKFEVIKEHVEILRKFHSEKWIAINARKHFLWALTGCENSASVKKQIITNNNVDEVLAILKTYLDR